MRTETMYRLIVAIVSIVIMTFGVYMVTDLIANKDEVLVTNTDPQEINNKEEEKTDIKVERLREVEVKYVDVYSECNHEKIYTEKYENTTNSKVKENIKKTHPDYAVTLEEDGMIIFQKKYDIKCREHYLVKIEDDKVVIYRIGESGRYEYYQDTGYTKLYIREDLVMQLETGGLYVDGIEELFMLLEDIEG